MKLRLMFPGSPKSENGQALALVAVTMAGLLGIAALGVDLGYLYVAKNQLQNVADGSALAGARVLGNLYQNMTPAQQEGFVCSHDLTCADSIRSQADSVAHTNIAAALQMALRDVDILIGQWDSDGHYFTETDTFPDAVQVIARRDDVYNGPVTTFFARILGVDASSVSAVAVAALTGQGTAEPGDIELPIGISRWFFDEHPNGGYCDEDIQFYPTGDPASCAGWTSWTYGSNDNTLRDILHEELESPETIADKTIFNFTGGTLSENTFDALLSLFQEKGYDTKADGETPSYWYGDDPDPQGPVPLDADPWPTDLVELWEYDSQGNHVLDHDGNWVQLTYPDGTRRYMHAWETTVPVYDRGDCSNPNQEILIVGFADVLMKDVYNAPDKLVRGIVSCDLVDEFASRGGGGDYGVKGSIPGLVW